MASVSTFFDAKRRLGSRILGLVDGRMRCPCRFLRTSRSLGERSVISLGPERVYSYIWSRNSVGSSMNLNGWIGVVTGLAAALWEAICISK